MSRTRDIVRLRASGKRVNEIARQLGVTPAAVCHALARHKVTVPFLMPEQMQWLRDEAQRSGAEIGDIARALLADAIEDARQEEKR